MLGVSIIIEVVFRFLQKEAIQGISFIAVILVFVIIAI